jgi:hypothetical protein
VPLGILRIRNEIPLHGLCVTRLKQRLLLRVFAYWRMQGSMADDDRRMGLAPVAASAIGSIGRFSSVEKLAGYLGHDLRKSRFGDRATQCTSRWHRPTVLAAD